MASIFASLNTAYTGLNTHQVMVNTVGHNIANANNEFYSRQRVDPTAREALRLSKYSLGQGVETSAVVRLHDEYIYTRYKKASTEEQFASSQFTTLKEASAYFPDMDGIGLYKTLQTYFDSWTAIAKKSGDPAQKLVLAQNTQTLAQNIKETRARLVQLQKTTNEELKVAVDEVNKMGKQIAEINKQIRLYESMHTNEKANDLRDKRDELEFAISKLIGGTSFKGGVTGYGKVSLDIADFSDTYNYTVAGGYSIVEGTTFHPLVIDNSTNPQQLYTISHRGQDFKSVDITRDIYEGKIGALLDSCLGNPSDKHCNGRIGKLQQYINDLDSFAKGMIEATNNIYAESAQQNLISDKLNLRGDHSIMSSDYNITEGSFDIVMYDSKGNELGRKSVKITPFTTMHDIVNQLNSNTDDNNDRNAINDFDDNFRATYNAITQTFSIESTNPSAGIHLSYQDKGTNFAGALGINRFLEGDNALTFNLDARYRTDPTLIRGFREAVEGNIVVANKMQQLQYDKVAFFDHQGDRHNETIHDYFKLISTKVATHTAEAKSNQEIKKSVLTSVKQEHIAISEVSTDEELTDLIRFQGGYTANAKVVSTLDKMLDTLLGLKQ
ncbi:MAG: flagellar hook-associated protein FlgK [Wolinella sp.]